MKITKIYGGPGTGKTTTLISTLRKELANGISLKDVAYLTHTRAGAEEVRNRIGEQFSDHLKKDLLWFRTIHSACCKIQGIKGTETIGQYHRELFSERWGYALEGNNPLDMRQTDSWDIALHVRALASATMRDIDAVRRETEGGPQTDGIRFYKFMNAWAQFKKDVGMLDFVDQLDHYDGQALPVKVMIVDEAQDLSKLQWDIIWKMAANCDRVYVAGDDDQSIYSFIGADEYGFLDLEADEEIVLTESYRVPKEIGDFATKIIRRNTNRKEKDIQWRPSDSHEFRRVANISRIPWDYDGKTFVLCRHNKQAYEISKHLSELHVAHSVNGKSIQNSPIANIAKTYLTLKHGGEVTPAKAARLADRIKLPKLAQELRQLSKLRRPSVIMANLPGVNWTIKDWTMLLAADKWRDRNDLIALRNLINEEGIDIIGTEPDVSVMTYHYSKGREADRVILMTDCYTAPWEALHKHADSEVRLCYVGATRTKKDLIIVWPETTQSLLPLTS